MTPRQQQILTVIRAYVGANGYAPTVREIAARTKIADSTVHYHLARMESEGVISRGDGARAMVLLAGSGKRAIIFPDGVV